MPRINLIGASNLYTNNTCEYGSMAGLAPTATVRPSISGIHGYKVSRVAANENKNGIDLPRSTLAKASGCGLGKSGSVACADGKSCLMHLNLWSGANTLGYFQTGRTRLLG